MTYFARPQLVPVLVVQLANRPDSAGFCNRVQSHWCMRPLMTSMAGRSSLLRGPWLNRGTVRLPLREAGAGTPQRKCRWSLAAVANFAQVMSLCDASSSCRGPSETKRLAAETQMRRDYNETGSAATTGEREAEIRRPSGVLDPRSWSLVLRISTS